MNHTKHTIVFAGWTENLLKNFRDAQKKKEAQMHTWIDKYIHESQHDDNQSFRIYVDAAYNEATPSYAVAYAIFDPGKNLWAAGYKKINPPGSVLVAELLGL